MTTNRSFIIRLLLPIFLSLFSFKNLSSQCAISVTAEVVNCSDALNTFNALITVTGTGVGGTFVLGGDGMTFGSFSYNSSPIEIGPFSNNGTVHNFAAIDNTTLTCYGEAQILPYTNCPVVCNLEITDVEFLVCDELSRFANVYIEHNANISGNFSLLINQVSQGVFSYGQDFYTIGPLTGNCLEGIGINVFDNVQTGCSDFYWQPGPYCCPDECSINDVIVNTYCIDDEIAGIIVDFNYNGANNERFEILMDSLPVDTAWVYEFPDTIFYNFTAGTPESIVQGFGISHVAKPNCGFYDEYLISCTSTPPCSFSNVVLSPIICDGENSYSLGIDFQVESASSIFFDAYAGNSYLGAYQYAELPIVIDNFPESVGQDDIITICDNGNNSCCETIEFVGLDCEASCNITNYFVEAHECDEEGMFNMYIQFDHTNGSDAGFIVRGNGIVYDSFQYTDAGWYTFGPLFADCETLFEFIVIDLEDSSCSVVEGFDQPICCEVQQNCILSNLSFEQIGCQEDLMGFVYNFDFIENAEDSYDLFSDGIFVGSYQFSPVSQFVTVPSNNLGSYEITICENDSNTCCVTDSFQGPSCNQDCSLSSFFVEAHECDADGFFEVDFKIVVDNPLYTSFSIFGDGNNYGSFEYGETFYTIGPFEGDCSSVYEFIVVDNDESDCTSNYLFLGPICCEIEDCALNDLVVTPIECLENNVYSISIDFSYIAANNDFFDVIVNNEVIGFHALADLPIIQDYPASGNDVDVLSICINDTPDCCMIAEFEAIDCTMNIGNCGIEELFAEASECDDEENIFVDITFDAVDGSDQGFEIRGNGTSYGVFQYGEAFYTVGPIEGDCETIYEFIVIDQEDPSCFADYVFEEVICCDSDACNITNLEVDIISCDSIEQIFFVSVSFDVANSASPFFTIAGNGQEYGSFGYGQDSYTIGPLAADGTTDYEFVITDIDNGLCSTFVEIGAIECMTTATDELIIDHNISAYYRQGSILLDNPDHHDILDLNIFNLDGKYLYGNQNLATQHTQEINLDMELNGIYILVLRVEDKYFSIKLPIIK